MHPWRERLARWFTPIARACPLSPNAITVIALLINIGAAILLARGSRWPAGFLVAIVLITIAGFADALDGLVARLQQKESRFGDFLDHVCDRISDTLLAAGWMIGNGVREVLAVWSVIRVIANGLLRKQVTAAFLRRE